MGEESGALNKKDKTALHDSSQGVEIAITKSFWDCSMCGFNAAAVAMSIVAIEQSFPFAIDPLRAPLVSHRLHFTPISTPLLLAFF